MNSKRSEQLEGGRRVRLGGDLPAPRPSRQAGASPYPGKASRAEAWTPDRLERMDHLTGRIADAMAVIFLIAAGLVLAVILWEFVKLYRSLPPGSMRMFGRIL